MSYKLHYTNLSDDQIHKLNEMNIPNTDGRIDEDRWLRNAKSIAESEIMEAEKAIGVFLNNGKD